MRVVICCSLLATLAVQLMLALSLTRLTSLELLSRRVRGAVLTDNFDK